MTDHERQGTKNQLLKALGDPLRQMILKEMVGKQELSPREFSNHLELPLSQVSYHFRVLARCKAIILVRTEPVRGSEKHFYRFAIKEPWAYEALGLAPPG